jgi:hypothetical protein
MGYEAYIFRPNAYNMITSGDLSQAFFSSQSGRTSFTPTTNPRPFVSNGSPDNIKIINISASGGDSMTFEVVIDGNINLTLTCAPEDQCTYQFIAVDSYGDGWRSNNSTAYFVVRNDANDVYRITALNHNMHDIETRDTFNIPLCNGENYELWWEAPSNDYCPSEISFQLLDPAGNVVVAKSGTQIASLPTTSSFFSVMPDCNTASIAGKCDFVSNVIVFVNELEVHIAAGEKIQSIELYNSLGQLVLQTVKPQFNLPNEGLYLVKVKTETTVSTHKVVGKR